MSARAKPGPAPPLEELPAVVLGSGYAGLTVAQEISRRSRGRIPVVLVDRNPVHVLRTQLYEIDRIAAADGDLRRWAVPLAKVLDRTSVTYRSGTVVAIHPEERTVELASGSIRYRMLAICLGNVAAYYHVPGAPEFTHSVYRLSGAQKLGQALREVETSSASFPGERRPRILVIGGGSTGTEVAAEIASTDWEKITGVAARPPDVFLITGSLPLLAGFPPGLVVHARALLRRAGVTIVHSANVVRVEANTVHVEGGTVFACEIAVWAAGLEAPLLVREMHVPHGKGGRIAVGPTLEVPGFPGVFAVGDVAEFKDPDTGMLAPGTAQAALAEARVAARNLVARWENAPLLPFRYEERGVVLALGPGKGAGRIGGVSLWGSPAALLKKIVQKDYSRSVERGETSRLL